MAEWGAFEAEDIVKFGYMMIKRPPTSTKVRLKAWQSKFFVLRDESRHSAQRLEYYKDEAAFGEDKRVEHSVLLDSIVYIGETHNSKTYQYALMVVCSRQGAFTLACDSADDLMDWLQALNKVAVKVGGASNSSPYVWPQANGEASPSTTPELPRRAYSSISNAVSEVIDSVQRQEASSIESNTQSGYLVSTRLTPLSERNGIRGDYVMCVTNGQVVLQSTNDKSQTVVTWPVGHLRAFKSEQVESSGVKDMRLLTLNVGRRSPTGEGILQFFTALGDNIANEIRLQSNYYVSKTAAEKREVFRRQTASSESLEMRSSSRTSTKKLPRTLTAPATRLASVAKRDGSPLVDSARTRADTDPVTCKDIVDEKHRSTISEPELQPSVSSEGSRSRSATDSSVEKAGDDEVFFSQPAVDESHAACLVNEEKEPNAYIDLVADENAEPMHISDPAPLRKTSVESHVSGMSLTEGSGPIPRSFANTQLISEENETDSEGYIKCEALQTGPHGNEDVNKLDGNRNVLDPYMTEFLDPWCPLPTSQSLPNCSLTTNVVKKGPTLKYSPGGAVNKKMRENLVAQIQAPTGRNGYIFPPKPTLERERALTLECVFPSRSRGDDKECQSGGDTRTEVASRLALLEKLKDPESSKKLFDQIIAQMEKPQQNDVNELFPTGRQKRNSIGAVSTETVRDVQQKAGALDAKTSLLVQTKHTLIENSNLTCESQDRGGLHPLLGPPPLPVRQEFTEQTCKRSSSSSMGDIFEDIHRRTDVFGLGDRPTFFAKGMRNKNPSGLLGSLRNTVPSTLGGEAGITARLIEKTEIRDEALGSCTTSARKFLISESKTCSISNGGSSTIVSREETFFRNSVTEKSIAKSLESLDSKPDEETHATIGRRKDSRTSKIVKKIWKNLSPSESLSKHSPKPRRGSNESRASDDISEDDSERPRRASLSPGDAILVQGRFAENEEAHTPESSPKLHRKISKSSPKSTRKTSRDDSPNVSRGLSSATRILRKVSKGESKRDECSSKSAFKPVPTSPSSVREVSKVQLQKKSDFPASPKLPNTEKPKPGLPPKGARWQSKDEKPLNSLESVKANEANWQEEDEPTDEPVLSDALGDDSAPALPPRKKSDPPPLPPRRARSSPSFGVNGFVPHSTGHHPARSPQTAAPSGRRHSGQKGVCILPKEEFLPPPPVPPRKENNRSPSPKNIMVSERSSARTPVIQLTCSSPENQLDIKEPNPGLEDSAAVNSADKASERNPPNLSTTHQSSGSLSHPVPRRPPKGGQRRVQAKEFFRDGSAQAVWQPSCDSEGLADSCVVNETDNNNLPSCSSRYGNVDDLKMACDESVCNTTAAVETHSCDESDPSNRVITESCHVTETSSRTMVESCRTVESQKGAVRLKASLRKEASIDETF